MRDRSQIACKRVNFRALHLSILRYNVADDLCKARVESGRLTHGCQNISSISLTLLNFQG